MPREPESLKLSRDDDVWATNGANRADDVAALANPINRARGWTSEYSVEGGGDLQRLVWNRLLHEISSFCVDLNQTGVLEYANAVNYEINAVVNHNGSLYNALVANGPAAGNATTPGTNANVWRPLFTP